MDVEDVGHRVHRHGIVGAVVVAIGLVAPDVGAEQGAGGEGAGVIELAARRGRGVGLDVLQPVPVELRRVAPFPRAHPGALVADAADGRQVGLPAGFGVVLRAGGAFARGVRERDVVPGGEGGAPDGVRLVERAVFGARPVAEAAPGALVVRVGPRFAVELRQEEAGPAAVGEKRVAPRVEDVEAERGAGVGAHVVAVVVDRFDELRILGEQRRERRHLRGMEGALRRLREEAETDRLAHPAEVGLLERRREADAALAFRRPDRGRVVRDAGKGGAVELGEPQAEGRRVDAAERAVGDPEKGLAVAQQQPVPRLVGERLDHRHGLDGFVDRLAVDEYGRHGGRGGSARRHRGGQRRTGGPSEAGTAPLVEDCAEGGRSETRHGRNDTPPPFLPQAPDLHLRKRIYIVCATGWVGRPALRRRRGFW